MDTNSCKVRHLVETAQGCIKGIQGNTWIIWGQVKLSSVYWKWENQLAGMNTNVLPMENWSVMLLKGIDK